MEKPRHFAHDPIAGGGHGRKTLCGKSRGDAGELIDRALAQRPDLVAKLANLRARQAGVRLARAAYYPKVSLEANGGWSKLDINAYSSSYTDNSKPAYGVGVGD